MASLNGFNANDVEPSRGFDPLPAGKYLAAIVNSEMKTTAAGTGEYLSLQFDIIDGEFANRKLFHNLNLDNPNQTAVQIARAELSAICRAVGVMNPADSAELHNLPLVIKVGLEKRKDTGEMQNRIKAFDSKDAKPPTNQTTPPVSGKPTGGGPAPWQKKVN